MLIIKCPYNDTVTYYLIDYTCFIVKLIILSAFIHILYKAAFNVTDLV